MKQLLSSLTKALVCLTLCAPTPANCMLRAAVLEQNIEALTRLLESKIDPNAKEGIDQFGNTPLHRAVGLSNSRLVQLLVKHRADPHAANVVGVTPLSSARIYGYLHLEKILSPTRAQQDEEKADNARPAQLIIEDEPEMPEGLDFDSLDDIPDFAPDQPSAQIQQPIAPLLLASIRMGQTPSPE